MRELLVAAFIAVVIAFGAATIIAQSSGWFVPSGKTCPIYYFTPGDSKSEAAAKKECEAKHGSCTRHTGSAAPVC